MRKNNDPAYRRNINIKQQNNPQINNGVKAQRRSIKIICRIESIISYVIVNSGFLLMRYNRHMYNSKTCDCRIPTMLDIC